MIYIGSHSLIANRLSKEVLLPKITPIKILTQCQVCHPQTQFKYNQHLLYRLIKHHLYICISAFLYIETSLNLYRTIYEEICLRWNTLWYV